MYLLISIINTRFQDRTLIALGMAFELLSLLLTSMVFLLIESPPFWLFVIGVFFFVIGLPFFFCCTASLLSKLVREEDVGLANGFLSSFMNLANILGPLWGGTFSVEPWLPFVGQLGLISLLGFFFSFSFKQLYVPRIGKPDDGLVSEKTPLIN